jgi:hypothetical protein
MRIHLADTPPLQRLIVSLMAGHPYRLVSYFYIKDLPDPRAALKALVTDDRNLIVDSGLFSFMFGSEKGKMPNTYEAYRDYTRKYLDDMAAWGLDCYLVEADTHRLLGMQDTFRLREEFEPLGSRCMYVWHQPEGLDGLITLAKERDYIGIGLPELRMIASGGKSAVGQSSKVNAMCNDLLRRVHAACGNQPPRIHLLGCTVETLMETGLAWSCDSTSWLAGIRFGQGRIWTARKGLEAAGIRSEMFLKFRELAMDANPLAVDFARQQSNPDYYLNCIACAHAYALYQKWLDARYSAVPMRGDTLPEGPMQ